MKLDVLADLKQCQNRQRGASRLHHWLSQTNYHTLT